MRVVGTVVILGVETVEKSLAPERSAFDALEREHGAAEARVQP
jgi:hypothetical protein